MTQLTSLRLAGWKSIRDAEIELRPLNVLIGANGAGKSNLVSFFRLMNEFGRDRFHVLVSTMGGPQSLLHYGSKRTSAIEVEFRINGKQGPYRYSFRMLPVLGNSLIIHDERVIGSLEEISKFLGRCQVFHFHDTSLLSPLRQDCFIDANRFLYSDASNLPAMLYLYRERYATAYRRIVAAVKAVAPFFDDFVLEPLRLNPRNIALHWRSKESEYEFGPHQLSDGTLRAIALFTLLLQPEEDLPALIVLDEPELGLHPAALAVLADLAKSASRQSQLLLATQSAALLDHFEVDDIITVNLRDGCSTFERLAPNGLKDWLEEYKLSDLWQRNVIGGGPY